MSMLDRFWRRLAALFAKPPQKLEPEYLSMRDWADLPPHHPLCDRG